MTTVASQSPGRPHQLGLEPGAAGQAFVADRLGVEGPPSAGRLHQGGEVAAGAHRLGSAGRAEQVEVAPAGRADEADAAAAVVADDQALALEQRDAERRAAARAGPARRRRGRGRRTRGCRRRTPPAAASRRSARAPCHSLSMSPARISSSAPGAGCGLELLGLEMQVGQELQPHLSRRAGRRVTAARPGAVADLELAAAAAGTGVVAADLGRARRTVSTW